MPFMDGLKLARRFRTLHPLVPILFISGNPRWAVSDQSALDGEQVLRKPFTADSFLLAVTQMLTRKEQARDEIA